MGLFNQAIRSVKGFFRSLCKSLFKRKKKKKRTDEDLIEVPGSWSRTESKTQAIKTPVVIKYKKRLPGLRTFKRLLAGTLLLINFVFSQFLLGTIGDQAQPMFVFFLLNSFILMDYLWKTRKGAEKG